MYVKVLQYLIFAILLFSSRGFPQENIPPDNVPPNIGPDTEQPEKEPSDDIKYDDEYEDNQPEGDDPDNAYGNDEQPLNEQIDGVDDTLGNDYEGNAPDGPQSGDDMAILYLPNTDAMLDRTKPEPGFDLTYEEILKLKLWPDGLIPYYIDVHSFSDKVLRDKIRSFLSSVNSLTSLNFVELPSPPHDGSRWVIFINRRGLLGCADHSISNFTNTGVQRVILGYHCMSTEGELAEAVLSIAGVPAQHNAPDRDYYIKINDGNIMPEKKYLFAKLSDDEWLFHDLEYDFNSAGHFHSYKHSINGRATIEPQKKIDGITIGESKSFTASDILKIRMLYNYMVKRKILQAPDCHKLFVPGKKFNQYKPNDRDLKPRPKPYKYTGENPDATIEEEIGSSEIKPDEDNVDDIPVIDGNQITEGYPDNVLPDGQSNDLALDEPIQPEPVQSEEIQSEQVQPEQVQPEYPNDNNEDYGKGNDLSNTNIPIEEDESQNLSPSDFHKPESSPVKISIGQEPVDSMNQADNQYSDNTEQVSLKGPRKKKERKPDLLSYLSDYRTDDDENRKLQLKFKSIAG